MKLLIIRHGQSTNNQLLDSPAESGHRLPDPGLTELGWAQARALGRWMKQTGARPDRVFTSLMKRTIQTATPLAEELDLSLEARTDLFECGGPYLGDYLDRQPAPGTARSELQAITDRVVLPPESTEQGWWTGPVESASAALARALAIADWLRGLDAQQVALVIHGAIGSMLISALTQPQMVAAQAAKDEISALDMPVWSRLDNTSVSALEITEVTTYVDWVNRIDHLASLEHKISQANNPFPPAFDGTFARN